MVRIDRFTSRAQADLACGLLRANGFDARVSADDAGGVHPDIPFGIGGTAIVVPDDQVEQARALLDEHGLTAEDHDAVPEGRPEPPGRSRPRWGLRTVVLIMLVAMIVAAMVTTADTIFG